MSKPLSWMWINKKILDEVGGKVPNTWAEFYRTADKIKAKGYKVIAHGHQDWQDATLFESVALSIGGAEFYKKAFIDHNFKAMKGETMTKVFKEMSRIRPYIGQNPDSDDWNAATAEIINGTAAFQFMGDWAKGEFTKAGKVPFKDYICAPVPGTRNKFLFVIDSLAMFKLKDADDRDAQQDLAHEIMSEKFQVAFNIAKGSIPARTDIALNEFDACANASMTEFIAASKADSLVPSIAHGMATTSQVNAEFALVVGEHLSRDIGLSDSESARKLAKKIRYGQYSM